MRVTLTFDNGPDPVGTPEVLDHLERRGIHAIFFVVGRKVAGGRRSLVAAAADAGHQIGNHTWSHEGPLGDLRIDGAARDEIVRTQDAIAEFARLPLFRPVGADPGGVIDERLLNEEAARTLRELDFTLALWNVLPRDWERPSDWANDALDGCRRIEHSVVVLHDAYPDGLRSLPGFLDELIHDGAEFVQTLPTVCTPLISGAPTPRFSSLIS